MGVTYIQYKVAKCDLCGETEQFDPVWSMPENWNSIQDTYGAIKYPCVCPECTKRIKGYIEEFKNIHYEDGA